MLRLVAVIVSTLLSLVLVELILRAFPVDLLQYHWPTGYYVSDPRAGYRMARSFPPTLNSGPGGTENLCFTNSLGLRDIEIPRDPAPEGLVVVLGDSMTYGWGAMGAADTWPRLLQQQIERDHPEDARYHLANAGVSGYNTFQQVALLEQLLGELEPVAAVLSFYSRTWERNLHGRLGGYGVIHDTIMSVDLMNKLAHLPRHILGTEIFDGAYQALLNTSRLVFLISIEVATRSDVPGLVTPYREAKELNYQALKYFRDASISHGIYPIVAFLPDASLFGDEPMSTKRTSQLHELCEDPGLAFIDPRANMRREGITAQNARYKLTHIHDSHYSPAGNALYAKALAPLLVEQLRVSRSLLGLGLRHRAGATHPAGPRLSREAVAD